MTKPAKDEAALLKRVGEAIRKSVIQPGCCMEDTGCQIGPCNCSKEAGKAALAAIRAAGWAVVPGWQPIETAPKDTALLLFCPDIGIANQERIELDQAVSTFGRERGWSRHAWAAAWMPLPAAPGVKP
jgi:hypothetical protein